MTAAGGTVIVPIEDRDGAEVPVEFLSDLEAGGVRPVRRRSRFLRRGRRERARPSVGADAGWGACG